MIININPALAHRPHRMVEASRRNPVLAAALTAAAPDVLALAEQHARLVKEAAAIEPGVALESVNAEVLDSLAEGNGLPADLLDRYAQAVAAGTATHAASEQLSRVASALAEMQASELDRRLPELFQHLHGRLEGILADLRPATAAAGGATTAEHAIAAGKSKQWAKANALRAEYAAVREAQRTVLAMGAPDDWAGLAKAWPMVGYASNLCLIWPDLPEFTRHGSKADENGRPVRLRLPWPDPGSAEFLDWLITHPEATAWVPTVDQALTLTQEIQRNTRPAQATTKREIDAWEAVRAQRLGDLITTI